MGRAVKPSCCQSLSDVKPGGTKRNFNVTQWFSSSRVEFAMPPKPIDPIRAELNRGAPLGATRSAVGEIQQKSASHSIRKRCANLFGVGRSNPQLVKLIQFRSYQSPSMTFSAKLSNGKVHTEGSHVGQDIADRLNQLPKRFMQDPQHSGKGLRLLDQQLNVFHLQSTPAVAAVLKSSRTLAAQALPVADPGRAHLGQISGVQTTADGSQFRLVDQHLYRFDTQVHGWLPDKDQASYSRLGLSKEGVLIKVPQGVADISVEGKTQVSLQASASGSALQVSRGANTPGAALVPIGESGEPMQLTRIGLSGDTLYAIDPQGELLRGDLRNIEGGRLTLLPVPVEQFEAMHKGAVSFKGFMHDDHGQLNALLRDARNQLHSNPLTDAPGQAPGWNLSDVILKVIDKGLPEPGMHSLANTVDLGQRGKVALQASTLLCWDAQAQHWDKTDHLDIDQLQRGLDGRAYVLQEGQLKALATHKAREPLHMGASYELAPHDAARTQVGFDEVMAGSTGREITGFAVQNAKHFVTLDSQQQLHAHINGAATALPLPLAQTLKTVALDHQGHLYAHTESGRLLKLEKAHWQNPSSAAASWTPVPLPGNEPLTSLRMGPDQQLIASWGGKNVQLSHSLDGSPKWQPVEPSLNTRPGSLGEVLGGREIKSQNNGTAWAVTSAFVGQKEEGLGRDRGILKGIGAHIKPIEGLKETGRDIQHHFTGRAGLDGLYADARDVRGQLDALAKTAPRAEDLTTRLERLSKQESTQELAGTLKSSLALVEKNSEPLAVRLGDLKGARVIPEQPLAVLDKPGKHSLSSLGQMRLAFENLAPSQANTTAALLRSYEKQGVALSPWSAEQKRDLSNPTALVESDLIHHARTLSRLEALTTRMEGDAPDQARIAETLKTVMQDYHDSPVHKMASQQINSFAQAETLYKNLKLLIKDLSTPGSALNFHITRALGLDGEADIKEALMQQIQQSDSGQSIASSRSKTKSAALFALGMAPVPLLEVFVGASRAKTNGITFSRTDTGATVDINMGTAHGFNASLGSGTILSPAGDLFGTGVRVGAEASLTVSREKGSNVSFDVKEADFPAMMEILAGREGDAFDLLDLGSNHQSGQRSKSAVDVSVSSLVQGRAHFIVPENSQALGGLVRSAISAGAGLNLAHFDQSSSVTQGAGDITRTKGANNQLLNKGGVSVGVGAVHTAGTATVSPDGPTLVGFTLSDISLTVSFDRNTARAMRFTFKQPAAVEQKQIDTLRDALSRHSPQLKAQLQATAPAEGDAGEQLQSLQRLFEKAPAPATRPEEHHALKDQLQKLLHQQELVEQGKRELSSVESSVSYVGLNGGASHEWLDDAAPANKAAILKLLTEQPELARALKDLESSKGTSVTIGLEVKPQVLRTIESKVGDGRNPDYDVQQALKNTDNLRVKTMSVGYTASRTHSMTLPTPFLSFSSSAALSHTHKLLNAEFEYGRDPNAPVRMKLKDASSMLQNPELHPELQDQKVRDRRRPVV